jgi:glyoxylase-like metal-dependent hydrolase (beta-lactamase superfamily II)
MPSRRSSPTITGIVVRDGETIDLGGVTLRIIATPGHSNCSICAYEPTMKALFASDAVGVAFKDTLFPSMNTNVDQYLESLVKVRPLAVSYLCLDHYGYMTGEEAQRFVDLTLDEGTKWKAYLQDSYRKYGGDLDAAARVVTDTFYKEMPDYFIAPDILEMVFKQMLKYIGKTLH